MAIFKDPFDPKAPLGRRGSCSDAHSQSNHGRLVVAPVGEEERWSWLVMLPSCAWYSWLDADRWSASSPCRATKEGRPKEFLLERFGDRGYSTDADAEFAQARATMA